jgi:hypothetical protein
MAVPVTAISDLLTELIIFVLQKIQASFELQLK